METTRCRAVTAGRSSASRPAMICGLTASTSTSLAAGDLAFVGRRPARRWPGRTSSRAAGYGSLARLRAASSRPAAAQPAARAVGHLAGAEEPDRQRVAHRPPFGPPLRKNRKAFIIATRTGGEMLASGGPVAYIWPERPPSDSPAAAAPTPMTHRSATVDAPPSRRVRVPPAGPACGTDRLPVVRVRRLLPGLGHGLHGPAAVRPGPPAGDDRPGARRWRPTTRGCRRSRRS